MCAATSESDDGPISDTTVAAVLRPFVRATRPLLGALSDSDPFGLQHRARQAQADPATAAGTCRPPRVRTSARLRTPRSRPAPPS